jgi:hypothetical protein
MALDRNVVMNCFGIDGSGRILFKLNPKRAQQGIKMKRLGRLYH